VKCSSRYKIEDEGASPQEAPRAEALTTFEIAVDSAQAAISRRGRRRRHRTHRPPTGPVQHHIVEARAQHRLDATIAGESEAVVTWLALIHQAVPATVEDSATIRVARECAEADPDGSWLPEHVLYEARRALPADHKADALGSAARSGDSVT
jgi:hypothetical protein